MNKLISSLILKFLPLLISSLSPVIRDFLSEAIKELEKKAKETKNPYDDFFIEFLKIILDIEDK